MNMWANDGEANRNIAAAIAESVTTDGVWATQLVTLVAEAAMKLRRVRGAGGKNLEPLSLEAANSLTNVLICVLDEVDQEWTEEGL